MYIQITAARPKASRSEILNRRYKCSTARERGQRQNWRRERLTPSANSEILSSSILALRSSCRRVKWPGYSSRQLSQKIARADHKHSAIGGFACPKRRNRASGFRAVIRRGGVAEPRWEPPDFRRGKLDFSPADKRPPIKLGFEPRASVPALDSVFAGCPILPGFGSWEGWGFRPRLRFCFCRGRGSCPRPFLHLKSQIRNSKFPQPTPRASRPHPSRRRRRVTVAAP